MQLFGLLLLPPLLQLLEERLDSKSNDYDGEESHTGKTIPNNRIAIAMQRKKSSSECDISEA